jgi:hypothetical protein
MKTDLDLLNPLLEVTTSTPATRVLARLEATLLTPALSELSSELDVPLSSLSFQIARPEDRLRVEAHEIAQHKTEMDRLHDSEVGCKRCSKKPQLFEKHLPTE